MASVLALSSNVFTDSGGLQKEAYWAKKPCITLREETEWVETLTGGANRLVGTDQNKIISSFEFNEDIQFSDSLYGDGNSAPVCVTAMMNYFK